VTELEIKAAVRERDGYRCRDCGMTAAQHVERFGKTLEVHRVVPGSPYTVDGCVTLCRPCHGPKPRSPRGAVVCRNGRRLLRVVLRPETRRAVDQYIAAQRLKPRLTHVVATALEQFFAGP
jgi:hypothetical protein